MARHTKSHLVVVSAFEFISLALCWRKKTSLRQLSVMNRQRWMCHSDQSESHNFPSNACSNIQRAMSTPFVFPILFFYRSFQKHRWNGMKKVRLFFLKIINRIFFDVMKHCHRQWHKIVKFKIQNMQTHQTCNSVTKYRLTFNLKKRQSEKVKTETKWIFLGNKETSSESCF